jgi:hypothetical protein
MEKLQPILAKLKGVLDHLEKVLLGAALIAVAFFCFSKLLQAKKSIGDAKEDAKRTIVLSGKLYEVDDKLQATLADLVAEASGNPKPLELDGKSNHMVFNPRKWKEIIINTNDAPILVPDSVKEPLGVSALEVTDIVPVRLIVTPVARLHFNRAKVLYQFEQMDYYPMTFKQLDPRYGPIQTFLPHVLQAQKISRRLTREENRGQEELHWWYNQRANVQNWVRQYHADWIVRINFRGATPTPPQFEAAGRIPPKFVDSVRFDLDIIYQTPEGQVITNKYQQILSKSPIAITRAYQADFRFQTKYHAEKRFIGYRVGRHLMMDGEALLIYKITPNEVHLVSDLAFGGNGKLYIKKKGVAAPAAVAGGAAAPVPPPQPAPKGPGGGQ